MKRLSDGQPRDLGTVRETLVFAGVRITKGAYPNETRQLVERYVSAWQRENEVVKSILRFTLLCVLESISYTRKDGQYLRWDHRSGRCQGAKRFDKGRILDFSPAICAKLEDILLDLDSTTNATCLFPVEQLQGDIRLHAGSSLDILPTLQGESYDAVLTSPPYCNRYDYTRTYALELALLGIGEHEISAMRQEMLSCTVENRGKTWLV